ncbi:MAG: alpha/beta hydrolase [Opitutaceae bacterium]|nr:alpha/beta hydrolase [Opitutaceae bacterium]
MNFFKRTIPIASILLALSLASVPSNAKPETERIPLWPEPAYASDGITKTDNAYITYFLSDQPNSSAVIICPGGGYRNLVKRPEGIGIAQWLNSQGITGIVLEYRLPLSDTYRPLLDAQKAIRTVRANARKWSVDPTKIGIMGFSAGGHLASTAATHFDPGNPNAADPVERMSSRPDFAILIYPVITMGDRTHAGSKANLLGENPDQSLVEHFSNELQITSNTPPAFLAHAVDDHVVSSLNSRMYYDALVAKNIPAKYLELPSGGHGLNGYEGAMWNRWQEQSILWLADQGWTPRRTPITQ